MLISIAWWLTASAGTYGIPLLGVIMLLSLIHMQVQHQQRRRTEIITVGGLLLVTLSLVSILNEHVIKPGFKVFRPNILQLASNPPAA